MAADFNPLDTSQRQKVLNIMGQLADAGLSEDDIMRYFGITRDLGRQNLQQSFGAAQDQLGLQFQPELMDARNTLGANPLLADSGYANRLNRQIMSDIAARSSADYNSAAAQEAGRQTDYLRSLYDQRTGIRSDLARSGYQTMTGLPKKPTTGQQIWQGVTQLAGAGAGAFLGGRQPQDGGGGGYGAAESAPSGAYTPRAPQYSPWQGGSYGGMYGSRAVPLGGPRRRQYSPFGDQ